MLIRSLAAIVAAALLSGALSAQVPFTVENYGPTCGPIASGAVTPNGATYRVAYTVSNAAPQNPVIFIIGLNEQSIPINFGMPCVLLTELAFTQSHRTDPAGVYTWSRALPSWFQGYFRVQFAEIVFDAQFNLTVRTSNGVYTYYNQ